MNRSTSDRAAFDAFYGEKWADGPVLWEERYPPDQRVYAVSVYRRRNEAIVASVPDGLGDVLDVGCGAGDVAIVLSDRARRVWAVDVSLVNARTTAQNAARAGVSVNAVQAGVHSLPFPDGWFDAVVIADVIEHVDDVPAALSEIHRVTRPGARVVCVTPLRRTLGAWRVVDWMARFIARPWRPAPLRFSSDRVRERFLDKPELRAMLVGAGFRVDRYARVCFYPAPETSGALGSVMRRVWDRRGPERFGRLADGLIRIFDMIARLEVLNQKQLWVVRR